MKSLFLPCLSEEIINFGVNSAEDFVNVKGLGVYDSLPVVSPDHGQDRGEDEDS